MLTSAHFLSKTPIQFLVPASPHLKAKICLSICAPESPAHPVFNKTHPFWALIKGNSEFIEPSSSVYPALPLAQTGSPPILNSFALRQQRSFCRFLDCIQVPFRPFGLIANKSILLRIPTHEAGRQNNTEQPPICPLRVLPI